MQSTLFKIAPEEMAKMKTAFRAKIVRNALQHIKEGDVRTDAILRLKGVLKEKDPTRYPDPCISAISDRKHPQRLDVGPGPLVVCEENQQRSVLEVADLLYDERSAVRMHALGYLEQMTGSIDPIAAKRTRETVQSSVDSIRSDEPERWLRAAVDISDCVRDDFSCNLAGLRQSLTMHYQDGMESYADRLFMPSVNFLQSMDLEIHSPREQHFEIAKRIKELVNTSDSLETALSGYVKLCGHIPLGEDLSAGMLVRAWIEEHGLLESLWDYVWDWVGKSQNSPLPCYHACLVFVANPEYLPEDKAPLFWKEVLQILSQFVPDLPDNERTDQWRIRQALAKYYCHYIACHLPTANGDKVATCAWSLAEHLSQSFGLSMDFLKQMREGAVCSQSDLFQCLEALVHPPVSLSAYRHLTCHSVSLWAFSMQCQIGIALKDLHPEVMSDDEKTLLGKALRIGVSGGLSLPSEESSCVFAFDHSALPAAQAWSEVTAEPKEKTVTKESVDAVRSVGDRNCLPNAFQNWGDSGGTHLPLVVQTLWAAAHRGEISPETAHALWAVFKEESFVLNLLSQIDTSVLDALLDALIEIQVQHGGDWLSRFPHYITVACKEKSVEGERRKILFAMLLASCLSSGTVSPLLHLLKSDVSVDMKEDIQFWHERLTSFQVSSPGWIAGRIRAVLAALSS